MFDRLDERALDLRAGRVAARVHDPRERVTALAGQEQLRALGDGSVSKCAPSRASSRTRSGPSVTRMRTASESQRPAPAVSVSTRCRSGVSGAASAAATPPCA